ncbi:MAG: hypothetical protein HY303_11865 [Candidatus Wallbacteria bacterium]|nr:hypothetical protein [Candidatus Wallbacteria bacterium]
MRVNADAWRIAIRVAEAFGSAGIEYAIGGALAFDVWGYPRGTLDVDVSVFVPTERFEEVCRALEGAGACVERDACRSQLKELSYFEAVVDEIRVDVFFPDWELYDWAYERRKRVDVEDLSSGITVLSVEDTLLFKLLFFRGKDKVDIESLMRVQLHNLDLAYIRKALRDLFRDEERTAWFESLVREVFGPGEAPPPGT